jgi:hypothetical protein
MKLPHQRVCGKGASGQRLPLRFALLCHAGGRRGERTPYNIDIDKLPLSEALQKFSDQTQLQYGYLPTSTAEEQTVVGPVKGYLTVRETLHKLLPMDLPSSG